MNRGAFDQTNDEYSIPQYAIKSRKYKCPCCNEFLILKKGQKNRHHFSHFAQDNKCEFYDDNKKSQYIYDHINEKHLHKQAKQILKCMLEEKMLIVNRPCATMQCESQIEFIINNKQTKERIEIEHSMNLANGRLIKSDVVKIKEDNEILEIYEIFDSHRTEEENRLNLNWYEFKAQEIINKYYDLSYNKFQTVLLKCCRQTIKCEKCITAEQKYLLESNINHKKVDESIQKKEDLLINLNYKIKKQPNNIFWKSLKLQLIRKGELSEKQIYYVNKTDI